MSHRTRLAGLAGAAAALALAAPTEAVPQAELALRWSSPCATLGDTVTLVVTMSDVEIGAVGFQAFLEFDPSQLEYVEGAFHPECPFAWIVTEVEQTEPGRVRMAAGIQLWPEDMAQDPASGSAILATLTFTVAAEVPGIDVTFAAPGGAESKLVAASAETIPAALLDSRVLPICPEDLADQTTGMEIAASRGPLVPMGLVLVDLTGGGPLVQMHDPLDGGG